METVTHDNLPFAVKELLTKVDSIEKRIAEIEVPTLPPEDRWLNINDLCEYHPDHPAKNTIYDWVKNRIIPYHKHGKKLSFLQSEIDEWLRRGRRKTIRELDAQAEQSTRN